MVPLFVPCRYTYIFFSFPAQNSSKNILFHAIILSCSLRSRTHLSQLYNAVGLGIVLCTLIFVDMNKYLYLRKLCMLPAHLAFSILVSISYPSSQSFDSSAPKYINSLNFSNCTFPCSVINLKSFFVAVAPDSSVDFCCC